MSRRGASGKYVKELYIEVNPVDAAAMGVSEGEKVTVASRRGEVTGAAKITDRVPEKMVFLPFHFGEASANLLTASVWDPTSETPAFKVSAVKVSKA